MNTEQAKEDLAIQYRQRFGDIHEYRDLVWQILVKDYFQHLIPRGATVLDLGCGWGEFTNNIEAPDKIGMDLNPDVRDRLAPDVTFINQDCSHHWQVPDNSLDIVFTSNSFEHVLTKADLESTIRQVKRCLKPGGRIICMGPNVKYVSGSYWDFWDHHVELTELSVKELLEINGLTVTRCLPKFLPYSMVNRRQASPVLIRIYLKLPIFWKLLGKQFLVIAQKDRADA